MPKRQPQAFQEEEQCPEKQNKNLRLKIRIDDLKSFKPLTENQRLFFEAYNRGDYFITLHGAAGSGKTFIAMAKALEEVLDKGNPFSKVVVIRSAVQSRDMGHLPGDHQTKMDIYQQPYKQICESLFNRKDAWDRLNEQKCVEFVSTSFIRGTTFDYSVIIVDETQNLNWAEISTVITRVGKNSKIIFCGDFRQNDLTKSKNDCSGLNKFLDIASMMGCHTRIEFSVDDIVRSSLVKDWIIAQLRYEEMERQRS